MIHVPRHVVIVGGSTGRDEARSYISEQASIWCVARIYNKVPYADLVFDMHTSSQYWDPQTYRAHRHGKLVTQKPIDEFPNAEVLPAEIMQQEFGTPFTSSFSWMTAMAIHGGATMISLLGVNMQHKTEKGLQRDGLLYLLGFAKARNIKINTTQLSALKQGVRI